MTDSQKAALDQLFKTTIDVGERIAFVRHCACTDKEREEAELHFDYLRTTFPDRAVEILKPKQSPMTNKEALDILSNTPILFSPHCISGLIENCGCWRCRQDRGEQATPETEERARIRCEEILKPKEGEELG